MDDSETGNGQEEDVAPPGWYADPYGAPTMRRWDGEHWTLEDKPWPTPEAEAGSSPAPFNWPALAAALFAAWFVAGWFRGGSGGALDTFRILSPLLVMLFGVLGAGPKYASGPGNFVALVLAVMGACLVGLFLLLGICVA